MRYLSNGTTFFSISAAVMLSAAVMFIIWASNMALADRKIFQMTEYLDGLELAQSKDVVFSYLVGHPQILSVWPQPTESYYIDASNVNEISVLKNAERLAIGGFGVSVRVHLHDGQVVELRAITTTSEPVRAELSTVDFDSFLEVLSKLLMDGTVDGVHSLPRQNPNGGNVVVRTTADQIPHAEAELAWLFSYDRWDFSEDGESSLTSLLFEDGLLAEIIRH